MLEGTKVSTAAPSVGRNTSSVINQKAFMFASSQQKRSAA